MLFFSEICDDLICPLSASPATSFETQTRLRLLCYYVYVRLRFVLFVCGVGEGQRWVGWRGLLATLLGVQSAECSVVGGVVVVRLLSCRAVRRRRARSARVRVAVARRRLLSPTLHSAMALFAVCHEGQIRMKNNGRGLCI